MKKIRFEALTKHHNRSTFTCGVSALDRYFEHHASQDIKRRIAQCFLALDQNNRIAGFYTLSAMSVALHDLPADQQVKIPKYPMIPAVLLGRLAVDKHFQGQGIGSILLVDALKRCALADIGAYALLVDAIDDRAAEFYEHFGFIPIADERKKLCLPIATALKAMGNQA